MQCAINYSLNSYLTQFDQKDEDQARIENIYRTIVEGGQIKANGNVYNMERVIENACATDKYTSLLATFQLDCSELQLRAFFSKLRKIHKEEAWNLAKLTYIDLQKELGV